MIRTLDLSISCHLIFVPMSANFRVWNWIDTTSCQTEHACDFKNEKNLFRERNTIMRQMLPRLPAEADPEKIWDSFLKS